MAGKRKREARKAYRISVRRTLVKRGGERGRRGIGKEEEAEEVEEEDDEQVGVKGDVLRKKAAVMHALMSTIQSRFCPCNHASSNVEHLIKGKELTQPHCSLHRPHSTPAYHSDLLPPILIQTS